MSQSTSQRPHKRGPWSQSEDSFLLYLVSKSQPQNWVRISQEIGTRSAKQCRERYHQNLKPSLNRDTITEDEGRMIEYLVNTIGKRWADIARKLNGRSDNQVKNWWNGSMNRRRRAESKRQHDQQQPNSSVASFSPPEPPSPAVGQYPASQLPLPSPASSIQTSSAASHLPPIASMSVQRNERSLHERRHHPEPTHYSSRHLELPSINTNTTTPRYIHSSYPLESPLPSPSSVAHSPGTEALSVPESPAYTTSSPRITREPRGILLLAPCTAQYPLMPTRQFREEHGKIILPPIASPLSTAPSSPSSVIGTYTTCGQQVMPQKDSRLSLKNLIN
ncbi:hypothetical protein MKZ38_007297 [Zalerion maritima]|uniref:Uncharacterized protein n=1 Tax=Zalerion maritima TaxID=339359 RepID=A0AAD5WP71_9PEZI|nr:hypothetical protein MKZ38_007297 [Zalerion maritima]